MPHTPRVSTWPAVLYASAGGMFLISSLLLARFMYIFPLSPTFNWASASESLLFVVSVAALAFFIYISIIWSFSQALGFFVISILISTLAEFLGLNSGVTFGSFYYYHPDIEPRIASDLPMVIPLAWFVFCCIPLILLRPWLVHDQPSAAVEREDASQVTKRKRVAGLHETLCVSDPCPAFIGFSGSHFVILVKRVLFCSLLLTSCNLYLEPLFVYTNSWIWDQQGSYHGAPLANLFGWFLVGLFVYSCFFFIQNRWYRNTPSTSSSLDYLLIALFLVWVVVALVMINEKLNSLIPLWLTLIVLGPSLCFRVLEERRKNRIRQIVED